MNVMKLDGVKVYNLTANRSLPEWASRSEKRKSLARDPSLARHIELIQELEMPDSTTYITCSPDQQYLFTLGRYKPRVRCYELNNLAMKFDRCVDYLPYRMVMLSRDYSKFALLEEERWVDVHAAGGHFFRFRVPRPGVDITYCSHTCDLLIAGSKHSIYRMNLSEGRFKTSLESHRLEGTKHGFTACEHSLEHNLILAGSSAGRVDGWDARTGELVFGCDVKSYADRPEDVVTGSNVSITSLRYKDALNVAVGTSEGMVYIYDLRQNRKPWHSRDTEYRNPVKTIAFHEDKVVAMLPRCVKVWNVNDGKIFVGFDVGTAECQWMYHFQNSGLFMLATESPKVATYFIPLLGEAPAWCSHLDKLVLECEPDVTTMYDGYKFLTLQQITEFGMVELIGTQFLRAYMHGYFVSTRLFNKIREKLGILSETSTAVQSKSTNQTQPRRDKDLEMAEELGEVSSDPRFAKLLEDRRMAFGAADKESDLMRIHQARLDKKRRRKEVRKDRAKRAQKLVDDKMTVNDRMTV